MAPKPYVLLVEDDEFLAELYATKLTLEGFEIALATDGEKAVRLLEQKKPDLVLLDIVLPKLDGFEVLKRIKENPSTQGVPVILLTNLSQKDEVAKGLALGAVDYLIKAHFMPSEVIAKIKHVLQRS